MTLLIGNIIAFVGCSLMVLIGFIKEKKKILYAQCIQFSLQGAANLILGGTSGFIANVISLARNLVFSRFKSSVPLKMAFIAVQLLLSASSLGDGFYSWLPIIATIAFTWYIDTPSEVILKAVIIFTQLLWLVYDFHIDNYVSMAFDIFTMISTAIGIYLIRRDAKKKTK